MKQTVSSICLSFLLVSVPFAASAQIPGQADGPTSAALPAAARLTMPVPGTTVALAKAAGINEPLPRWRVMREVIRRVHAVPLDDKNIAFLHFAPYLSTVDSYEGLLQDIGEPEGVISLALAEPKERRERLKRFLEFVGLKLKEKKKVYRVERESNTEIAARRALLEQAGADLAALESGLNSGAKVPARLPSDTVPLPVPLAAWKTVFGDPVPSRRLASAILLNRQAAHLYYGLTALDAETRRFVTDNPKVLTRLNEDALRFSTLSGGLHLADGRLVVPGGPKAEALWQSLVGAPPTEAERFIRHLYSKDDGKLAYFYDTLAHLQPGTLSLALGLAERDAQAREARFQRLYAACSLLLANWSPGTLPFLRIAGDSADLLHRLRIGTNGTPLGPPWVKFWAAAFDGADIPDDPAGKLKHLEEDGRLGAAEIIELLCVPDFMVRKDRTTAFLWAQRLFPNPNPAEAPQLLAAVRGFWRHPALGLILERMGIDDPALCATAMRTAARLSSISDPEIEARSLAEFQAALAILERVRFARTLDVHAVTALVRSLVSLPLSEDGEYSGFLARWVEGELLPSLRKAVGANAPSAEAIVLAAMAGHIQPEPALPRVVWEDVSYRVDAGASEQARLERIRNKQGGNRLDDVLAFARAVATLATSVATLEGVKPAVAALETSARGVIQPQRVGIVSSEKVPSLVAAVKKAVGNTSKIKKPKDLSKLPGIAAPLVRLADIALADTLTALVYLAALGDPTGTASLAPDLGVRHDFGMSGPGGELRMRAPWMVPVQSFVAGASWHVTGSLLGLDVALAPLALRRVTSDRMPAPPTLNENERQALSEAVVFTNRHDLHDADRETMAAAVAKGIEVVASLPTHPGSVVQVAAAAPLPEWRAEALEWLLVHEPEELDSFFGLSELLGIGAGDDAAEALNAWGTSEVAWSGRLASAYPHRQPWDVFEGRRGRAGLAARFPDLAIWSALNLREAKLPATLTGDVLAAVTQDFIDEVRLAHDDDWLTASRFVRALPHSRLEDYVAALTATGPLVPETK